MIVHSEGVLEQRVRVGHDDAPLLGVRLGERYFFWFIAICHVVYLVGRRVGKGKRLMSVDRGVRRVCIGQLNKY